MAKQLAAAIALGLSAAVLAGCSSGSGSDQLAAGTSGSPLVAPTPHHHKATHAPTPAASASSSPTPVLAVTKTVTASPTMATMAAAAAQDLVASPKVRGALVAAGAKSHGLTAADYTGLVPGQTYYGYNPATSTYWAGGGLVPSPSSMPAQVSVQDDGSYLLFSRAAGGKWSAVNVGLAGVAGATCPMAVPAGILAVWHWKPGSCRPPG
ncbi:MAG TPA: hypothetical protein VHV79_11240 [Mycobacteriales bacterium]|jgi:hypothetical protein|nr:hypothetical protein [Mycobacteriales bacterium]